MRILLLLAITCVSALTPSAQSLRDQEELFDATSLRDRGPISTLQASAIQQRQQLINDEVAKTPDDEWLGEYALTDGPTSGAQLHWAPRNGFVVWWNTCSYGWRDKVNFGSVSQGDGLLNLTPALKGEGEKLYPVSADLVRVKWGERHYLVPSNQMIAFCYAVLNAGRSLEINEFFLKVSDRDKRRFGLPVVPRAYKKYLTSNPIKATIVELKPQPQQWHNDFKLNVGRAEGVVPGMKFFATFPRDVYMLAEVVAVTDHSSEVHVITTGFKNGAQKDVKVKVGWKLTSRAPKRNYTYYPG